MPQSPSTRLRNPIARSPGQTSSFPGPGSCLACVTPPRMRRRAAALAVSLASRIRPLAVAGLLGMVLAGAGLSATAATAATATATAEENTALGPMRIETLAQGLEHPWALALLPEGQGALITERPGRLRLWRADGGLGQPIGGLPEVYAKGQGGLLDVVLAPDFDRSRRIYLSYAEAGSDGKAGTAVGHGTLNADYSRLEGFTVIFRQEPKLSTGHHFGSRLVFDRQGELFVTLGENNQRPTSQDLDKLQGKVVRLHADGRIPQDNPFVGRAGARAEIWSYGHRNPQGAALNPWTGALWLNEHGPRGGDEINLPQAGANYGWPLATHGRNYTGFAIPEAKGTHVEGTVAPHHVWLKSPGVSGMAFVAGPEGHPWRGSLFIGALAHQRLLRLTLDAQGQVQDEERLLAKLDERIRDVRADAQGRVYVLTDESRGQLLRLSLGR